MSDQLLLNIEIKSDDGRERKREFIYDLGEDGTADRALEWFAEYFDFEAKVEIILNDFKSKLPDPGSLNGERKIRATVAHDMTPYYDSKNTFIAWMEIQNILLSAREHLAQSRAYKALEPTYSGKSGPENHQVYIVHLRKMDEFNQAVMDIKKLEDMVLRLIFESLSASLEGVRSTDGQPYLKLDRVCSVLKKRDSNAKLKSMSDAEYGELTSIVDAMTTKEGPMEVFRRYRNALVHREPESVDYPEQFPAFEARPEPNQLVMSIGSIVPDTAKWRFQDLYATGVTVYEQYIGLLERLDRLPIFLSLNPR